MTTRTLIGLAVALAALALLALYGHRSSSPDVENDGLLLPQLASSLDDIDSVTFVGAGDETLATLERREAYWAVAQKAGYPADVAKLREAMLGLAEARIVEQKTSNPDYYERLGVEPVDAEAAAGIAITASAAGMSFPTVIVGDAAGSGYRYVRRADQAVSYMVDGDLDVPRTAAEWVDPSIVDIRGQRVREVTIEHPDGETVRISKADADQTNFTVEGVPEGRELLYPGVANVIGNALRELRLEDVESAAGADAGQEGAPEPVQATYRTFDGLVVTITGIEREDSAWIEVDASADSAANPATPVPGAADAEPAAEAGSADSTDSAGAANAAEPANPAAAGSANAADAAGSAGSADSADSAGSASSADEADAADAAGSAEETDDADAAVPADAVGAAGAADEAESPEAADPAAEAARINERVSGWRYRIPTYQFDQMTRRMSDLLKAAEPPTD